MSKLKKIQKKYGILKESYSWERQQGKSLPTLADVQAKYNAKKLSEQEDIPAMPPSDRLGPDGSFEKTLQMTKSKSDKLTSSLATTHQEFKERTKGYDIAQYLINLRTEIPKYLSKAKRENNLLGTVKILSTMAANIQEELQTINNYIIKLNLASEDPDMQTDEEEADELMGN
jgi:hypothetical protein